MFRRFLLVVAASCGILLLHSCAKNQVAEVGGSKRPVETQRASDSAPSREVPARLEIPAEQSRDWIIHHLAYSLSYSKNDKIPYWVSHRLEENRPWGTVSRSNDFRPDSVVRAPDSAALADYRGSGFDRGHLAPAGDFSWSRQAMSESFFLTNMAPQVPAFNRGVWLQLEKNVRIWQKRDKELHVTTGPVLAGQMKSIGASKVSVAPAFFKVVLDYREPETKAIGFVIPNQRSGSPYTAYAMTVDKVESITGIDFFPGLPDSDENRLESQIDVEKWFGSTRSGVSDGVRREQRAPASEKSRYSSEGPTTGSASIITVYVTRTGKKYHRSGCRHLRKSRIPIGIDSARRSYGPCSVCRPGR